MKYAKERKTKSLFGKIFAVIFIIISLIIQLVFYYFLIFGIYIFPNSAVFDVLNAFIMAISLIVVAQIYNRNINTSFKLTWTILILLFPLFGMFFYLFYGNHHSVPKKKSKLIRDYLSKREKIISPKLFNVDKETENIITGLEKTTQLNCYKNTNTEFFNDIIFKYQNLKEDLKKAKNYIFLEFFILAEGKMLDEIYQILKEKGNNGVKIYIIYDDVGSKPTFSNKTKEKFKNIENLRIKTYAPFGNRFSLTMNYRDHRKIVVIDGIIAYCGGDNLADEYIHEKQRFGFWRDNALKIEGEAVEGFVRMFLEMWYMTCKEKLSLEQFINKEQNIKNDNLVMPYADGPTYLEHPSYSLFLNLIASARETIYISTPYFIIDQEFINALCRALYNGVKVIIMTPSIPDKKSVYYLTREHYKDILKNGGKIYEFSPGFNHAKNIIIDNKYAFVGTVNIDYRSFFLHFECGVVLMHNKCIEEIKNDFENTLLKCEDITKEKWNKRPIYQRIIAFLLSFFSPLF